MRLTTLSHRKARRRTSLNLNAYDAPHIRHHETTRVVMGDAILTMLIIYVMAVYYYGARASMLLLVSVATAIITDVLCILMAGKKPNRRDFSPIVTGMLLPLLMPASIDYAIVVAAAFFAICIAKHPFGGVGHNVFNPAAAGFAFAAICFGDKLYTYPLPFTDIPVFGKFDVVTGVSPAFTLTLGGTPSYDIVNMALGNFPGPMGATNIVVLLTCLLYLVSRNTVRWVTPLSFFITVAGFAFLFPRIGGGLDLSLSLRLNSIMFEMMSGMLLFGGIFLLGDPVTIPKRGWSKVAFAVMAGVAVMLFRWFGNFEEEIPFAILLMNATVWGFDMLGERAASVVRRRKFENISRKKIQENPPVA